jgi:hypothetical protein
MLLSLTFPNECRPKYVVEDDESQASSDGFEFIASDVSVCFLDYFARIGMVC